MARWKLADPHAEPEPEPASRRWRPVLVFVAIWAACVALYWVGGRVAEILVGDDSAGFTLLYVYAVFYLVLPVGEAVCAGLVGAREGLGWRRWLVPLAFGALYALWGLLTYDVETFLLQGDLVEELLYHGELALEGVVFALVGLGVGSLVRVVRARRTKR